MGNYLKIPFCILNTLRQEKRLTAYFGLSLFPRNLQDFRLSFLQVTNFTGHHY